MGPLQGITVIEIAGIGPGPFAAMSLADMGADVIRVERPGGGLFAARQDTRLDLLNRGKRCIGIDLKTPEGVDTVLQLAERADALLEGNRPGVMERLGLGPDVCLARNPGLVYGRMTGWGQNGPLAPRAGHDANYVALSGFMSLLAGADGEPLYPPLLAGDLAGGGAYLAVGLLAAILEASRSGVGQVVDAAIVDGAVSLLTPFIGMMAAGIWQPGRESNVLGGAAPFVGAYRTADDRYVFVSPLEQKFFIILLDRMGIDDIDPARQYDRAYWPRIRERLTETFAQRTRDEWVALLEGEDACCSPVLSPAELASHPHLRQRSAMVEVDGLEQPAPAPKFSRTPAEVRHGPANREPRKDVLERWGVVG